jgi:hypothetical protein
MASSFESSDGHSHPMLKPLRVPSLKDGIFATAKELLDDLPEYTLDSEDESKGELVARRAARLLGGESKVVIRIEGPEEIPSTTVTVRSETGSGLLKHDKANVLEIVKLLSHRVV